MKYTLIQIHNLPLKIKKCVVPTLVCYETIYLIQ